MKIKSKVKISLKKGSLPGYSLKLKRNERRLVLLKIAKKDTPQKVIKRLNVLFIFNKNKHPITANKFKRDMKFIQKTFSTKKLSKKRSIKKLSKKPKKRSTKQLSKKL